jgi:hypothetical protein
MANAFRPDPDNPYRVDPIYVRMTLPRNTNDNRSSLPGALDLFGELSVTSQFKVTLYFSDNGSSGSSDEDLNSYLFSAGIFDSNQSSPNQALRYEFMCNETSLPGASLSVGEEIGSRQGISETFANRRVFEPITMTFYVDAEYGVIRLFEEWLNFINPLYDDNGRRVSGDPRGGVGRLNDWEFYRFRYPNTYKRNIAVTKFERDMVIPAKYKSLGYTPNTLTYYMINAYPIQLTALPVTYEGSTITKTTVTFNYDRYVILNNPRGTSNRSISQDINTTTSDRQTILTNSPETTGNISNNSTTNFGKNSGIDYP